MPIAPRVTDTPKPVTYFAVTAVDPSTKLESDYSVEVSTTGMVNTVALTWDQMTNVTYRVYWGTNSRSYKSFMPVSTNYAEVIVKTNVYQLSVLTGTNINGSFVVDTNFPTLRMTNMKGNSLWKLEIKKVN